MGNQLLLDTVLIVRYVCIQPTANLSDSWITLVPTALRHDGCLHSCLLLQFPNVALRGGDDLRNVFEAMPLEEKLVCSRAPTERIAALGACNCVLAVVWV